MVWSQKEQDELDNENSELIALSPLEMFLSSVRLNVDTATLAQL